MLWQHLEVLHVQTPLASLPGWVALNVTWIRMVAEAKEASLEDIQTAAAALDALPEQPLVSTSGFELLRCTCPHQRGLCN